MARPISQFVSNFDGGARANLYEIVISGGPVGNTLNDLPFFAKGAQLPASTLGEIPVPYLGRVTKIPGDRTYEDFTVTIMNTEDMQLRIALEAWNAAINGHESNVAQASDPKTLWADATAKVKQLTRKNEVSREYELRHVFPKEIGAVELAYDNNDSISEFTVTFGYTYFVLSGGGPVPTVP
jgi:hypothetical protein